MTKYAFVFAASFGFAAFATLGGCTLGDDCNCPEQPDRPDPQGPLADLRVSSYDPQGNFAVPPITPEAGTLEVVGDSVVINYAQGSTTFRVEYGIIPP